MISSGSRSALRSSLRLSIPNDLLRMIPISVVFCKWVIHPMKLPSKFTLNLIKQEKGFTGNIFPNTIGKDINCFSTKISESLRQQLLTVNVGLLQPRSHKSMLSLMIFLKTHCQNGLRKRLMMLSKILISKKKQSLKTAMSSSKTFSPAVSPASFVAMRAFLVLNFEVATF